MTTPLGRACLLVVQVVSWFSIPFLLAGSPKKWYSRDFLYVWGLYLILFGFSGMRVLAVGNPAGILNALMILSIVGAVRTRDYRLFWVAIIICSMVKFYYLAFLLLPIILDKRYFSVAGFLIIFVAAYSMNYVFYPDLFSEYVTKIALFSHSPGGAGWSLFSLALSAFHYIPGLNGNRGILLAFGIHFLFMGVIVLVAYAISERYRRPIRFDLLCCWYFMSAFLISPRIFDYDVAVLTVPFVLLGRMLIIERGLGITVALSVAVCGFALIRTPMSDWSGILAIMGVWIGAAVHLLSTERVGGARASRRQSRHHDPGFSPN
jgi:hypothetical protein